jgi:hypothetical protein
VQLHIVTVSVAAVGTFSADGTGGTTLEGTVSVDAVATFSAGGTVDASGAVYVLDATYDDLLPTGIYADLFTNAIYANELIEGVI